MTEAKAWLKNDRMRRAHPLHLRTAARWVTTGRSARPSTLPHPPVARFLALVLLLAAFAPVQAAEPTQPLLDSGGAAGVAALRAAEDERPVVKDDPTTVARALRPDLPTLYIAGDSTAEPAKEKATLRGWGTDIGTFFDPEKINVVCRAIGGRSARTFITEGRWDRILAALKPGDFVLVQFGHNDAGDYRDPKAKGRPSIHGEGDETAEAVRSDLQTMETIHTFGWYLRKYANDAKARGAIPILLSKIPHQDWQDGRIVRQDDQETFIRWTRNAAAATGALFVDANEIISLGYERLGPQQVEPLFADRRTHTSAAGARYNAAAIIAGFKGLRPNPLAPYFSSRAGDLPASLQVPSVPAVGSD